ncbi:hypothetical protein KR009_012129 [Drosophila setifemur]|nr:hypothetical protein KR009_012129 [Drosophila setifemur]
MLLSELLLLLGFSAAFLVEGYDRSINYWEAFAPGKLLQRLDAITDVDPAKATQLPEMKQVVQMQVQAQEKLDEDVDVDTEADADTDPYVDVEADEVDSQSAEGYSGEDYERNYENFVKEYFDRAADNDDDDGAGLDQEHETQAEASNVKHQRCRRLKRKDGQVCEICRKPKNNEMSETCSYSHEDEPKKYAYDKGSQYKRYRNEPDKDQDEEAEAEAKTGSKAEEHAAPSSLCVRRQQERRLCYECKDSKGHKMERCYDVQAKKKAQTRRRNASTGGSKKRTPRSQQSQQSEQEQRIYKRTISYSYAQGMEQQQEDPLPTAGSNPIKPTEPTEAKSARNPMRRRRLVKITRRLGPVRVQ